MTTKSRRAAGLTIAWMVVAAAMATFAWQAVSAAGSRVNQQPLYPLSAGVPVLEPDPSGEVVVVPIDASNGTTTNPSSTAADEINSFTTSTTKVPLGASTTTSGSQSTTATSSTNATTSTSTSSTSAPTSTTTSTTASVAMQRASYTLLGGTITIEYGSGEVVLISAVPKAGFATDIDSSGPSNVDVDFRSETHRSKFDATMSGGQLVVSTEEKVDD